MNNELSVSKEDINLASMIIYVYLTFYWSIHSVKLLTGPLGLNLFLPKSTTFVKNDQNSKSYLFFTFLFRFVLIFEFENLLFVARLLILKSQNLTDKRLRDYIKTTCAKFVVYEKKCKYCKFYFFCKNQEHLISFNLLARFT